MSAPYVLALTLGFWDTPSVLDKLQAVVSLRPGTRVTLLCPRQSGREIVEGKPG